MLKQILEMNTWDLFQYLQNILVTELGLKVIEDGENYIFYEASNSPLCLVAHIDTIKREQVKLEQSQNIIRNKYGVLGADDRAGVYGIIQLLYLCREHNVPYPSVLFTNFEEQGGIGVKCFIDDWSHAEPFKNTWLFIELDRANANQYVYYSWDLPFEVKNYVESFGFVEQHGSYSDIADLTEAFLIPSVNLSVGYYNQHTAHEQLHVDELQLTINRVFAMLQNPIEQLYPVDQSFYEDYWNEDELLSEEDNQNYNHFTYDDFERAYQIQGKEENFLARFRY